MLKDIPFLPQAASAMAGRVDLLYLFLIAVSVFFFVLVATLVFIFAIRYRKREGGADPTPIHGSLGLELLWTIIPFCLSMVMFGWGAVLYFNMFSPPEDAQNIYVVGKQWMWKIQHPEGNREIDELHVPLGASVRLIMTSEDVIHSFYVPAFRMKMDVVPGRYTSTWFKATKIGKYHLFCAEYCGTKHSEMVGSVYVMDPVEYEDWLNRSTTATKSMAEVGGELFTQLGCQTCHFEQSGGRGPSLHNLYDTPVRLMSGETVKADDGYLRQAILDPAGQVVEGYLPIMPTYKTQVDEEDVLKLIAYIKSLALPQKMSAHPAEENQ
ncbi:MAG: cytochrome c oxidase subunit II [Acidobacteriota bacterium]|jgi:cytochrome c oxidase subunit 2